jgi:hypothetical protein
VQALPTWLADAYWLPAAGLMAYGQGQLMPAIRRTPPGAEAKRQSRALHGLLTAVYFLPLVLAPATWLTALLARLLLFDPLLNLAAGDKPFAVGQTAASDRALQWLATKLSWPPERVRGVAWLLSVAAACYLLIVNWK